MSIRLEGGATTTLSGAVQPFEVEAKGERLRAAPGAPAAVAAALAPLRASSYWKGVAATGGAGGVTVERDGAARPVSTGCATCGWPSGSPRRAKPAERLIRPDRACVGKGEDGERERSPYPKHGSRR